jgi:hypothetical protein
MTFNRLAAVVVRIQEVGKRVEAHPLDSPLFAGAGGRDVQEGFTGKTDLPHLLEYSRLLVRPVPLLPFQLGGLLRGQQQ